MKLDRILNRRLGLAVVAATLATAAPAHAAPQWLTPQAVSQEDQNASQQQVAFDQNGDAVAVWDSSGGPQPVVMASARPAGGAFSAPQTLSDPSEPTQSPDVAGDAEGDAVAVWLQSDGADYRVLAAYRPAGGSFGAPQTLSPAGYEAREPRAAMNAAGEAVIVWSLASGLSEEVQASTAAPGGTFGTPVALTSFTSAASLPQIALDSHGDAIAVWEGWDGANVRIEDAVRPAGGSFAEPQYLSPAGDNAGTPQVAFDAGGDALAVWRFDGSPASTVQGAYRPAGGAFDPVQTISAPSSMPAQSPQVAFDGAGDGVVAWQQSDGSELSVYSNVRAPGDTGSFGAQTMLDPGAREAYEPRIAGDGLSATIVSWKTFNGIANTTEVAVRPAGGSFAPATAVSAESPQEGTPEVGVDAQGDGIAVWSRASGPGYQLEAAGYAAAGPLLRGLTLPTQGVVGQPLQFFLAPLSVWSSVLSEGFSFGDGSSASGFSATHIYTAPGSYRVSATATDVLGDVTTVTRTITIASPPAADPPPPAAIRCTLTAGRTQRLLRKGTITAEADCATSIVIALDGRVTVTVPRAHDSDRGKHRKGSTLHSYTLKGGRLQLAAGRHTEVRLSVPHGALRSVLDAFARHRGVGLYLTLTGVSPTQTNAHATAHLTSISLASAATHTRRGR
jgi:PKD domain